MFVVILLVAAIGQTGIRAGVIRKINVGECALLVEVVRKKETAKEEFQIPQGAKIIRDSKVTTFDTLKAGDQVTILVEKETIVRVIAISEERRMANDSKLKRQRAEREKEAADQQAKLKEEAAHRRRQAKNFKVFENFKKSRSEVERCDIYTSGKATPKSIDPEVEKTTSFDCETTIMVYDSGGVGIGLTLTRRSGIEQPSAWLEFQRIKIRIGDKVITDDRPAYTSGKNFESLSTTIKLETLSALFHRSDVSFVAVGIDELAVTDLMARLFSDTYDKALQESENARLKPK